MTSQPIEVDPWRVDLGHDHTLRYIGWAPDRDLNPQYADQPDVGKYGASIAHLKPDGSPCDGMVTFDGPVQRAHNETASHPRPLWTVESWEPLTLSPSVLCRCGDHGFIREGRWVPA